MAKIRGYRAERMDPDYAPPKQTRIRERYYHPTKGWRLPARIRRDLNAKGVKLA